MLDAVPLLSPLAWPMVFSYPVHKIGPAFQPEKPDAQPVCLVVYRNRKDKVGFLEINPATARMLEICAEERQFSSRQILQQIASELPGAELGQLLAAGEATLAQLRNLDIIRFSG